MFKTNEDKEDFKKFFDKECKFKQKCKFLMNTKLAGIDKSLI